MLVDQDLPDGLPLDPALAQRLDLFSERLHLRLLVRWAHRGLDRLQQCGQDLERGQLTRQQPALLGPPAIPRETRVTRSDPRLSGGRDGSRGAGGADLAWRIQPSAPPCRP
jgi:hypothetical protein